MDDSNLKFKGWVEPDSVDFWQRGNPDILITYAKFAVHVLSLAASGHHQNDGQPWIPPDIHCGLLRLPPGISLKEDQFNHLLRADWHWAAMDQGFQDPEALERVIVPTNSDSPTGIYLRLPANPTQNLEEWIVSGKCQLYPFKAFNQDSQDAYTAIFISLWEPALSAFKAAVRKPSEFFLLVVQEPGTGIKICLGNSVKRQGGHFFPRGVHQIQSLVGQTRFLEIDWQSPRPLNSRERSQRITPDPEDRWSQGGHAYWVSLDIRPNGLLKRLAETE